MLNVVGCRATWSACHSAMPPKAIHSFVIILCFVVSCLPCLMSLFAARARASLKAMTDEVRRDSVVAIPTPEKKQGFFSRVFGRKKATVGQIGYTAMLSLLSGVRFSCSMLQCTDKFPAQTTHRLRSKQRIRSMISLYYIIACDYLVVVFAF